MSGRSLQPPHDLALALLGLSVSACGCQPVAPPVPPAHPAPSSANCRAQLTLRHAQQRPRGLESYLQPLTVVYALDTPEHVVARWENHQRERSYIGSCMIGLAGLKPATWRQPADTTIDLPAGKHELLATHRLRLPVGGYPGALTFKLSAKHSFELRCGENLIVAVAPDSTGSITAPLQDRLALRIDESTPSVLRRR